jgi:flagellar protein FliL
MTAEVREEKEAAGGKAGKSKKKRSPLLLILLIGIPVLLLGALLGVHFLMGGLPFLSSSEEDVAEVVEALPRYTFAMQEFQVNLADEGTRRFLRTTIDLAYNEKKLTKEIETRQSELRSHIISVLRSKFVSDLGEPGGMEALEQDLLQRLNSLLKVGEIEAIYYKEFIFQ